MNNYSLKLFYTLEEMIPQFKLVQELYPEMTFEKYTELLQKMLPHNYRQIVAYDGLQPVGLSGIWVGHKLWCEKYLEMDNVVVHSNYRSKGIGKLLYDFIEKLAVEEQCQMLALDSYTTNFAAHKFFLNQGLVPKGFHFIKYIDSNV
ncbi:MAG: GNAT family N-acetyltransferase [Flavobacterium sp.]